MTRLLLPLASIAGAVMTMAGPVPIEQIQPGALVWCAPENGGGTGCFRPVLETYRNHAPEVWAVSYDHDSDPATPAATLTASAGHPFWIEESRAFVPAADLRPGQHLRLADGGTVPVTALTRQTAPPGGIPVFNLAVAEHHTYHAGNGGVWVHNVCPEGLERLRAKYFDFLKSGTKTKDEAANELYEWMRKDKTDGLNGASSTAPNAPCACM